MNPEEREQALIKQEEEREYREKLEHRIKELEDKLLTIETFLKHMESFDHRLV